VFASSKASHVFAMTGLSIRPTRWKNSCVITSLCRSAFIRNHGAQTLIRGSGSQGVAAAKGIAPPHNPGSHLPAVPSSTIELFSYRFLRIRRRAFCKADRNSDDNGSLLVRSLSDNTAISREKVARRIAKAWIFAVSSNRSASLMFCSRRRSFHSTHRSDVRLASKARMIRSSCVEADGTRDAAGVNGEVASMFAEVFPSEDEQQFIKHGACHCCERALSKGTAFDRKRKQLNGIPILEYAFPILNECSVGYRPVFARPILNTTKPKGFRRRCTRVVPG
jgi:hypothetical protein